MSQSITEGSTNNIYRALVKLAPKCSICEDPKLSLCTESCCKGIQSLYCWECETELHFAHRTNDLSLLFSSKEKVLDVEKCIANLSNIGVMMKGHREKSQQIINSHLSLIELYTKELDAVDAEILRLQKGIWYKDASGAIDHLISGTGDTKDTRKKFQAAVAKLDLSFFD